MTRRSGRATDRIGLLAAAVAILLAASACGGPCINGSLDAQGNCLPVDTSECVMRNPGDPCLDTGTCNTRHECEIPGGVPQQLR